MNNRILNKNIFHKKNNNHLKEETKNSGINSKNSDQILSTKSILNKKKNNFFRKNPKNNRSINFQKLIISSKLNKNNSHSPESEHINRNLSFNNIILPRKSFNKNSSQSILNNKQNHLCIKNLKQASNKNLKNIIKGKTYFIRNLDITEEIIENSANSSKKLNNHFLLNNCNTPSNKKTKTKANNNKIIFKNNSFISNNNNAFFAPSSKIKNCFTNLIINKNDSNNNIGKNKIKGIPFSLKKNQKRINSVIDYKNNDLYKKDSQKKLHSIYKNEKLFNNKKSNVNKVITFKGKHSTDINLTDKNNINDNLKNSFCNNNINKKICSVKKKGFNILTNSQILEFSDNKSFKLIRKFNLDEESKKEDNFTVINLNKGKYDIKKQSINNNHKNIKKNLILIGNRLNYKNFNKEIYETNENESSKIINCSKSDKNPNPKNKNSSFIKRSTENTKKFKDNTKNKKNLDRSLKSKENNSNNAIIISYSELPKNKKMKTENLEPIKVSPKISNNNKYIKDVQTFKNSHLFLFKSKEKVCIEIKKIIDFENVIEIIINFCDLETLNKLCLISKKFYKNIRLVIYKIIMKKVFNYNKKKNNNYKNKIKSSIFKYSTLSEKSNSLLEKKYKDYLFENNNMYDGQIKKDLTRTLPGNSSFQYGNNNYNKLYHILTAYSNFNKNIGYVQGLNVLAANSIFAFEKEVDAFLFLDALIQKFRLEDFIGVSNKLSSKLEDICNCINKYIPKIKEFFSKMNLNYEFFIAGWVVTLFSNSMDNQYLFYIWDYMIIFGWEYFYCFVAAVLKKYENEILSLQLNMLTFYMKNILRNKSFQIEFENIINLSFDYLLTEKKLK